MKKIIEVSLFSMLFLFAANFALAAQSVSGVSVVAKCSSTKPPCPKKQVTHTATYKANGDFVFRGLTVGATYNLYVKNTKRPFATITAKSNTLVGRFNVEFDVTEELSTAANTKVVISGGFELGVNDYGRPVTLIASMLGVTPDVFRQAFSGVTPATNGEPTEAQAGANKTALLSVLAPYGVTNEKLDEVANYYRFNPAKGEKWPQVQATAEAVIENGKVTGVKITNPGVGYAYPPTVVFYGPSGTIAATATVNYTKDFKTNGSIAAITLKSKAKFSNDIVSKNRHDYKIVKLANKQIYYGIITSNTNGIVLEDVFYTQGFVDFSDPTQIAQATQISLVKAGAELDGGTDRKVFSEDSIISIETLKPDSRVYQAISAYNSYSR